MIQTMASKPFGKDQSVERDHYLTSLIIFGDILSNIIYALDFGLQNTNFPKMKL